ncbi:MAG: SPOR domain-containing protein [Candidatus Accumulibacter sp.]|jgi:DedD protein|nr:SPOR domain-containing protein [Accumulibacter sp.]
MPPLADLSDADLQLKKRARRRLIGAVAFAGLVAVVLPMVMDEEPKQAPREVPVRIPSQEQTPPFKPTLEPAGGAAEEAPRPAEPAPPGEEPTPEPMAEPAPQPVATPEPTARPVETPKPVEAPKPVETPKPAPKPVEKPTPKPAEKPVPKPAEKPAPKPPERQTDAQRAAAILSGQIPGESAPAFVILIGAFSNPANVKILQTKLGELGIKVYTEPLESPDGRKTRVRAGPFDSRAVAERALEKMKRIGVNGVVAARQ